jgi:hypothetical protein
MSLYSPEDERRIRSQALVREWTKSGLLDPAQGAALEAELRVAVRRTNIFLRAGLALFTVLIVAASVAFTIVVFDLDGEIPTAMTTAVAAVVCLGLAQYLVVLQRFYRFGVEEALAVGSVVLIAVSAFNLSYVPDGFHGIGALAVALLVTGAGGLGLYRRFGYVYAAIGGIACAAAVPFHLDIAKPQQHTLAASALAVAFLVARTQRTRYRDEYQGDDYALVQAAAWGGLYLALNLQLTFARIGGPIFGVTSPRIETPFYWFTYAMIWALPPVGLYLAIRDKDRALLDVSLVMTLVTFLTNKPYLGWPRHEWDPILLGVFLMAAAIAVRRWLSAGPNGQRAGFTPARILSKDRGAVTILGTASAGLHPDAPRVQDTGGTGFDGGRSGGGGASGGY